MVGNLLDLQALGSLKISKGVERGMYVQVCQNNMFNTSYYQFCCSLFKLEFEDLFVRILKFRSQLQYKAGD